MRPKVISPCLFGATDWIRTNDLRFTKPLQAVFRGSSASIFERLKAIDSEIESLQAECRALLAELQKRGG
jgi:hypothetical protein